MLDDSHGDIALVFGRPGSIEEQVAIPVNPHKGCLHNCLIAPIVSENLFGFKGIGKMTTLDARKDFSSVVEAANKGERFLLKRHGKMMAAVVSIRALAVLRAIEDRFDREAADAALKDIEANGTLSWDEMKASLGLLHDRG